MGAAYFIGFVISSILVPRVSDKKYGRKKPYLISLLGAIICYVMLYLSTSIYFHIIIYLCLGLCGGGRVCVGLAYMNEFIPEKYHNMTITIANLGDCCILLF